MYMCVNMFLFTVFILNVYQLSCSTRTTTLSIRTRNTLLFCSINYLTDLDPSKMTLFGIRCDICNLLVEYIRVPL